MIMRAGVEVRSLLDDVPNSPEGGRSHVDEEVPFPRASARDPSRAPTTPDRRDRISHDQEVPDRNYGHGSPEFGGGVGYHHD